MIRIAVVDDDNIYLARIDTYFREFMDSTSIDYELKSFSSGKSLLESVKKTDYNVLVLDIDMPEVSGIEIAEYIRKINSDVMIIFVTNMDNLVFESIKYSPFRFVRKTKMDAEMPELLDSLKDKYSEESKFLTFNFDGKVKAVKLTDIVYFESVKHEIYIHMKDNTEYRISDSLNSLIEKYGPVGFIRLHKSYIVNFRYIFEFQKGVVILDDNTKLPISKNRMTEIKKEYIEFTRKELQ